MRSWRAGRSASSERNGGRQRPACRIGQRTRRDEQTGARTIEGTGRIRQSASSTVEAPVARRLRESFPRPEARTSARPPSPGLRAHPNPVRRARRPHRRRQPSQQQPSLHPRACAPARPSRRHPPRCSLPQRVRPHLRIRSAGTAGTPGPKPGRPRPAAPKPASAPAPQTPRDGGSSRPGPGPRPGLSPVPVHHASATTLLVGSAAGTAACRSPSRPCWSGRSAPRWWPSRRTGQAGQAGPRPAPVRPARVPIQATCLLVRTR